MTDRFLVDISQMPFGSERGLNLSGCAAHTGSPEVLAAIQTLIDKGVTLTVNEPARAKMAKIGSTKTYKLLYKDGKILNDGYDIPNASRVYPGDGVMVFEAGSLEEMEGFIVSEGLVVDSLDYTRP
ncbi:hypothetical protein [Dysgonomonas sp. 511]|uniref:hypothetical protein n=1 Tax=Dysgonomonas sp. 511 TaxID=2302930 RepID=UPI0013D44A27|nr:hypothetical protein [Dysgonomonas sp. 511]